VTTTKLVDGAVTTPKLGDGAVTATKLAAASATRVNAVDGLVNPNFDIVASTRMLFPQAGAYPGGMVLLGVHLGGWVQAADTAAQSTLQVQVFVNRPPAAQILQNDRTLLHYIFNASALGALMPWTYAYGGYVSPAAATALSVEVWAARSGGTATWKCTYGNAFLLGLS
jgi:hypothetical protein